jgi:hypothetical protein
VPDEHRTGRLHKAERAVDAEVRSDIDRIVREQKKSWAENVGEGDRNHLGDQDMRNDITSDFRPLSPPSNAGQFAVRLRSRSLYCPRCGREFKQHQVQPIDGGIRFICACGLDLLEATPS